MYVLILPFAISDVLAGYKEDIGYTALENEFGTTIPAGGSLSLVTQAEGSLLKDHDGDDQTDKIQVWAPDPARPGRAQGIGSGPHSGSGRRTRAGAVGKDPGLSPR